MNFAVNEIDRPELRLSDISEMLDSDWITLASSPRHFRQKTSVKTQLEYPLAPRIKPSQPSSVRQTVEQRKLAEKSYNRHCLHVDLMEDIVEMDICPPVSLSIGSDGRT